MFKIKKNLISVLLVILVIFSSITITTAQDNKAYAASNLSSSFKSNISLLTTEEDNDTITENLALNFTDNTFFANQKKYSSVYAFAPVKYIAVSLSGNGKGTMTATVKCYGGRPGNTSLNMYLQSKESGRGYKTEGKKTNINFVGNSNISKSVTTKNRTRFWRVHITGKYLGNQIEYNTYTYLYNKKAARYIVYTEPYSCKKMWTPPTNLKIHQNKRDSNFRNNYIKTFKKKYPKAKIDWSKYQIHHMQPLQYNGSNSFGNGIALTKNDHSKVTAWWRSY